MVSLAPFVSYREAKLIEIEGCEHRQKLETILNEKGPIKKIGVIGMGYVGIPAAALFADSDKFDLVLGFQRDSASSGYKIEMLNNGESPLKGEEPGLDDLLKKVVDTGKFVCTPDFSGFPS
ncbi:MAG: hypothetical protein R2741_15545 [Methanolobus sp.]